MKCTILRWLLGIWLVETVAARHILNGEDTGSSQSRNGRDQFHPFYQQSPHLNYNSYRSSLRRTPPQAPSRRNLIGQEAPNSNDQQYYNNYFTSSHNTQNQQNLNVYSAVRLHGALEARARNEPGSNTLLPTTQHVNYFHPQQDSRRHASDRHWRRDDDSVDGESFEREDHDDLARFSLYNSYFDNEHSIKALNSMKCVTPTGSAGFCSTFRGCVPSFFTKEGELEAPALAELISTSIGYCTTNVSHHYIREQRQQQLAFSGSREERRFNSVANRIICCPGVAPVRDPNEDPDKIFNDYIESQNQKTSTTTTTEPSTTKPTSEVLENIENGSSDSPVSVPDTEPVPPQADDSETSVSGASEGSTSNEVQDTNQHGSQPVSDTQQPIDRNPNEPSNQATASETSTIKPELSPTESEGANLDDSQQQEKGPSSGSMMYPDEDSNGMNQQQETQSTISPGSMMYPEGSSSSQSQQDEGSPTETSPPSEASSSSPDNVSGLEEASQQPDEQEVTSAPASEPPSNDETEPQAEPSSPPGSEQTQSPGKLPPQTQDSHIIKIYPEPVSGVNGKFTLPGGIYIVSTSTDTPNNNQPKPVHPSAGEQVVGGVSPGDETIVGSKPIIIVTNPGSMPPVQEMPQMPSFPSDFPPMGSQESPVAPIDESSLELQQRPVSLPPMPNIENMQSASSPMSYPSSSINPSSTPTLPQTTENSISSGIANDEQQQLVVETTTGNFMHYPTDQSEVQTTTGEPQQDESANPGTTQGAVSSGSDVQNPQQDESDMPTITTIQPQQQQQPINQQVASSDSSNNVIHTTNAPLSDDDDENDALTIIPINENPSEKSSDSTTTEASNVAAAGVVTTMKSQSSDVAGQEQQGIVTTITIPKSTTEQSPEAGSASEDVDLETTTIAESVQQQITTLSPDSAESEEESEETRVTPGEAEADIQKTTNAPMSNEFIAPTTTVNLPVSNDETAPSGVQSSQEEEVLPSTTVAIAGTQKINENEVTTIRQPVEQELESSSGDSQAMMYPPGSQPTIPEMQYPTNAPSANGDSPSGNEDTTDLVLNPGSEAVNEGTEKLAPSDSAGLQPEPAKGDDANGENAVDQASETTQPFLATSPASTGEAGESEQQQLFPGSESAADQSEQELLSTIPPTAINDEQQPFPGNEPEQSFPVTESSTVAATTSGDYQQSGSGSEQPVSTSEPSATSESSQSANDGDAARLPTTGSPISNDIEQNDDSESVPSVNGETTSTPGGEHTSSDGASSNTESSAVSSTGSESGGSTNEPSGISGSEPLPAGTEPTSEGSEPPVPGTEPSNSGSEPSSPGASIQGDEPIYPGGESLVSEPATATTESAGGVSSSSQSSDLSDQGSESSPVPNADSTESSVTGSIPAEQPQQPASVPSNDEPTSADDSESSDNELSVSSSSAPPTGGAIETEGISQEYVPSVPSNTSEDASPVQGSSPQADSPVSSDNMQDSQPVISTSEVPQDVSSPASIESTSDMTVMYPSSTAASLEPLLPPQNEMPNYQILKACKFQTFFRSVNDMTYSHRHYPWLATIVGGTRPFSSGTLITDRHILTASHFLANITVSDVFNMRIHIGYRTSYSGQTEGPYAVRKVRKVIRHKGFSFEKLYNDIAVLVLDRPVRFSEDIYPVCISNNRNAYADGTVEAFETGWIEDPRAYTISQHHNYIDPHIQKYFSFGYKNITWRLQEAPQRVRTNAECQSNYSFLEKNGIMVTDSMVCAGSGDTRSCAFRGNSGAPLFMRNDNDRMTEQIGIVSFGIGCGHFPFVFTRVESFLPWLDRVVYNSR